MDTEVWNLMQKESFEKFLSQLVLFGDQGSGHTLDQLIVTEITQAMGYRLPRSRSTAQECVQRVKTWAQRRRSGRWLSEHLPELGEAVAAACSQALRPASARRVLVLGADGRPEGARGLLEQLGGTAEGRAGTPSWAPPRSSWRTTGGWRTSRSGPRRRFWTAA